MKQQRIEERCENDVISINRLKRRISSKCRDISYKRKVDERDPDFRSSITSIGDSLVHPIPVIFFDSENSIIPLIPGEIKLSNITAAQHDFPGSKLVTYRNSIVELFDDSELNLNLTRSIYHDGYSPDFFIISYKEYAARDANGSLIRTVGMKGLLCSISSLEKGILDIIGYVIDSTRHRGQYNVDITSVRVPSITFNKEEKPEHMHYSILEIHKDIATCHSFDSSLFSRVLYSISKGYRTKLSDIMISKNCPTTNFTELLNMASNLSLDSDVSHVLRTNHRLSRLLASITDVLGSIEGRRRKRVLDVFSNTLHGMFDNKPSSILTMHNEENDRVILPNSKYDTLLPEPELDIGTNTYCEPTISKQDKLAIDSACLEHNICSILSPYVLLPNMFVSSSDILNGDSSVLPASMDIGGTVGKLLLLSLAASMDKLIIQDIYGVMVPLCGNEIDSRGETKYVTRPIPWNRDRKYSHHEVLEDCIFPQNSTVLKSMLYSKFGGLLDDFTGIKNSGKSTSLVLGNIMQLLELEVTAFSVNHGYMTMLININGKHVVIIKYNNPSEEQMDKYFIF